MRAPIVLPVLLAASAAQAAGPTVATLKDLGPAITACWHPTHESAGSQLTVVLSLNRDGGIIGKPRITFSKLVGSPEAQQNFVAAVLGALAACTPVALSPGLGGAVAGRLLAIRFIGGEGGTAL